jgi:hypothetical protein
LLDEFVNILTDSETKNLTNIYRISNLEHMLLFYDNVYERTTYVKNDAYFMMLGGQVV